MNIKKLKQKEELLQFSWDLFMLSLLSINLLFLLFDWIFQSHRVQDLLQAYAHPFFEFYTSHIHKDFILIDLVFIYIFLSEFIIRWLYAIYKQSYHRWFFYPFVYWYDLLGCIPFGAFRLLRILRVAMILYRWQKIGAVNLEKTYIFKTIIKYYNIFVEEISDRVVVNVLDNFKEEIKGGIPVTEQIIQDVIKPQQSTLTEWLSHRISKAASHTYHNHQYEMKAYFNSLIARAVNKNEEISDIEKIPVVGNYISDKLERAISDIVFNVVHEAMQDLSSSQKNKLIDEVIELVFDAVLTEEEDRRLNDVIENMIFHSLELIKEQVNVKQWKLKELAEKAEKTRGDT